MLTEPLNVAPGTRSCILGTALLHSNSVESSTAPSVTPQDTPLSVVLYVFSKSQNVNSFIFTQKCRDDLTNNHHFRTKNVKYLGIPFDNIPQ